MPSNPPQTDDDKLLLVIIAIFIPPLAVYMKRGVTGAFWLNLILTLLFFFYIIALVHALIIVMDDKEPQHAKIYLANNQDEVPAGAKPVQIQPQAEPVQQTFVADEKRAETVASHPADVAPPYGKS